MKRIKRVLACILAITVLITCNSNAKFFYATEIDGQDVSTGIARDDSLTVEGTNSFGSLFANELETEMDEQEENNGCNVFSVEMYDTVAAVKFETTQYAMLVVGIYDDAGMTMLASGKLEVRPGETEVYVDIDIETMPEYFYIRAFLIDEESMRPLCTAYESSMYTQEMQEFLSKTTDDFDADRVLNLDEDKTNNFAVYSDETIIVPESDVYNKVTQCDEENNTYKIENVDSSISNLQAGDIFSYEYQNGDVLIVKIASISIDGTTATIIGEDTSMEEVFDYVKIDETSYTQDSTVDESTCEEGVVYEGDVEMEDDEEAPETYAVDESVSTSFAKKFSFLDKKLGDDAKLSGSIELKVNATIKLYIAKDSQYMEVKLDYKAKAALAFSGKLEERSLPLAYFEISPVPGVYIKFTPSIVMEVSAKVEVNAQLYGTIGFRASAQEGMKNLTTTPKFKAELKGEITVFIGLSLKPQITIVTEKLADASLQAVVGAEAKGTTTYSTESEVTPVSQKIHDCDFCIDGDINAKASIRFKANIFDSDTLSFELAKTFSIKIADFYFSFDYGEFGFTSCPHYKYKVTFTVLKGIGHNLHSANIMIDGVKFTTLTEDGDEETVAELKTDVEGKAEAFLPSGSYKAVVNKTGYSIANKDIEVEDEAVSVWVWMKIVGGESEGDGSGDSEDEDGNGGNGDSTFPVDDVRWETFCLGDNHSGVITSDGDLYMWGDNTYGQVGNGSIENQIVPVKVLENVVSVSLGSDYSGAITEDGSLYMWGNNIYGQIGNGNTENQLTPVKILENVISVSFGWGHNGAITLGGDLYMWGFNCYGQVGKGTTELMQVTPIKVLENIVSVSFGGYHSGAVTADGELYMWGNNSFGQVGNAKSEYGKLVDQLTPVRILENVVSVSLGSQHSGAITEDRSLYMWGDNYFGEIGNGSTVDQLIPVKILEGVESVVLGDGYSGAIKETGDLYMWGGNSTGEVGNGATENQLIPIKVLENTKLVELKYGHSGAVTNDGKLYMWGYGYHEFIWSETEGVTYITYPQVNVLDDVLSVSLGGDYSGALTTDGKLYLWGENDYGQVGNGSTEYQVTPLEIMDGVKIPTYTYQDDTPQLMSMNLYTTENVLEDSTGQATFTDLIPNEAYNFYVTKDKESTEPFDSTNLFYITQAVSDDSGNLTVSYAPTEQVEDADVFIVPMSQTDISSAQIELQDLEYTGEIQYVNPVVTLNGTVLTEGKDYELLGEYSALEEGEYTVTIHGIGLYIGRINITYNVFNDEDEFASLIQRLEEADFGTTVYMTIVNETILPKKALELIREKEIIIVIMLDDETMWTINGVDVSDNELHDTDILVTKTAEEQLIFAHGDFFDFLGQLTLNMTETVCGNKGILLQNVSEDESIKLVDTALIIDGTITFEVDKGLDSVIIYGFNGDINADASINIKDMMQMLHYISGRTSFNEVEKAFADVDMSDSVNLQDLMREMHYVSGRTDEL